DGLLVVPAGTEAEFLAPRPIRDLPMVGPKTAESLASLGVRTIGDLARLPVDALVARFGSHGAELHQRALGIYDAPVLAGRGAAKSISREITFDHDLPDGDRLHALLRGQAESVAADLASHGRSARTVTLKLRFPPFETLTRATTLHGPTDLANDIFEAALGLFDTAWAANHLRPVRLLGVGVTNLQERARQLRLGETTEADTLQQTVGVLRSRFGDGAVRRASELGHPYNRHVDDPARLGHD
ncbi:MAG TPA: hypothetical protein VFK32_06070, partial [Tepidiformaceae bacterium]|nr:hypothetical protein [Tepidiformaceae bacterium]